MTAAHPTTATKHNNDSKEQNKRQIQRSERNSFELDSLFHSTISLAILAVVFAWRIIFAVDLQGRKKKQVCAASEEDSLECVLSESDLDDWRSLPDDSFINLHYHLKSPLSRLSSQNSSSHYWDAMSTEDQQQAFSHSPIGTPSPEPTEEDGTARSKQSMSSVSHLLETDVLPSRPTNLPPAPPSIDHLESPPIAIATIGVQRDAAAEEATKALAAALQQQQDEENERWQDAPDPFMPQDQFLYYSGGGSHYMGGDVDMDVPPLGFLDAITEEDSDELRSGQSSQASQSFANSSARTASSSSAAVEQVHAHIEQILQKSLEASQLPLSQPSFSREGELPTPVPKLVLQEEAQESLKGDKHSPSSPLSSSSPSSETDTVLESTVEEVKEAKVKSTVNTIRMMDADRDQFEVMVPVSDQFSTFPQIEDGRVSSTSMSINLDRSRDSLLDQSVCSNPRDESSLLASSTNTLKTHITTSIMPTINSESRKRKAEQSEKASSTSSDEEEEAPLPPPPLSDKSLPATAAIATAESVVAGIEELQPSTQELKQSTIESLESGQKSASVASEGIQPVRPISGSTERIASFVYGYGGATRAGEPLKSPLVWSSTRLGCVPGGGEEVGKENSDNYRQEVGRVRRIYTSQMEPRSGIDLSGKTGYGTGASASVFEVRVGHQPFGQYAENKSDMNLPPATAPPPPPLIKDPFDGYREETEYSKDDLISEGHRSRSTIREIPIQRSASAFAPSSYMSSMGGAGGGGLGGRIVDKFPGGGFNSGGTGLGVAGYGGTGGNYTSSSGVGGVEQMVGGRHLYSSGVQGIPTNAAVPLGGSSTSAYTTTKYQPAGTGAPHEEYYRREVLTRTLVTRSTEALSGPPLSRSSPIERPIDHIRQLLEPSHGDEVSEEYWYKYSRNVEEEERRIRENQVKRRKEEEDRRLREEEKRRRWEQQELEQLERLRREREKMEKEFEYQVMERERAERDRVEKDRIEREAAEKQRREEWERLERERRQYEESELKKRRQLERLEKERLERERIERERLEMERLERERLKQEQIEKERIEREIIERERIEIERLEIERIERIKREQKEKDQREKERQRKEAEKIERERLEAERLHRERIELERRERELIEIQRREAEQRDRERREDELREQRRRQQEQRERELLEKAEREAMEREMQRKLKEKAEQERLDNLRREQERLEFERLEVERRERQRQEEERREKELIEAQHRARERREQERIEENRRELIRQEEERREQERRQRERIEAQERERQRLVEEQRERERVAALEAAAAERRAQRQEEERLQRNIVELERRTEETKEIERREAEKREKERTMSRLEEERRLAELRELERRNAELRDAERREAAEREANRRREDRRSHDRLDLIVKEREDKERWENERKRVIAEKEAEERKRHALTSKETLERLTRKPYYSRENLSSVGLPDVTTKVERQIIERVDRTLWTNDDLRYGGTQPSALYPGNGHPPLLDTSPTYPDDFGSGAVGKERIYNPRDDDFRRGGSTRTSKYKARMEKARKEFLQSDTTGQYDPLSDRFHKSTEDLGRKVEYRGPLLQKFHSGEFSSSRARDLDLGAPPLSYSRMGPSPYDQEYRHLVEKAERSLSSYRNRLSQPNLYSGDATYTWRTTDYGNILYNNQQKVRYETNLDDVHRSKSALVDYDSQRPSRKDGADLELAEQHSRSKSADYLLDRRIHGDVLAPENQLQKSIVGDSHYPDRREIFEHEERFRKSVEKLHVPDWYKERQTGLITSGNGYDLGPATTTTTATSGIFSGPGSYAKHGFEVSPGSSIPAPYTSTYSRGYGQSYPAEPTPEINRMRSPVSPPIGGISFPAGMFDKYKNEIEDLRRSRTSLHQIPTVTPQEHIKDINQSVNPNITREYSREAFSKTDVHTITTGNARHQPGYTVSSVPQDWNLPRERNSRVVEVADTFIGKPEGAVNKTNRYGGRITVEEVLDSIFQQTAPIHEPLDPSLTQSNQPPPQNADGPGIYTSNYTLMDNIIEQPHLAESLLKKEPLYIRCCHCQKTKHLREARNVYVSCKHCYSYYCSRSCRQRDWERHRDRCSFARINTLCKEVIMKVRRDPETQYHMSKVAREGYRKEGRGSVNIRLISAHSAQMYLDEGWKVFASHDPNQLLFYYPIQSLIEQRKEPSLIQLCRKYNPTDKFILSVSIIADIEQCPETPPPEPITFGQSTTYQPQHRIPPIPVQPYSAIVPTNV